MESELKWLGLADIKVKETLKNTALASHLQMIATLAKRELEQAGIGPEISKQQGTFLYQLGTRLKSQCQQHIPLVVRHIINGNIRNEPQMAAAIDFLLSHTVLGVNERAFMEACGAGIVIPPEVIEDQVAETICKYKDQLLKERYTFNVGRILSDVKSALRWADGALVKREVDLRIMLLLGPKTEEDLISAQMKTNKTQKKQPPEQSIITKKAKRDVQLDEPESEGAATIEELMKRKTFHKVGENFKTDGYVVTPKTVELLKEHVKAVGGKVVTRFPPEPNGVLHIGHAKAININFGYAKAHGGICYLRFDDTNPEKEEEKFFNAIEDIVRWLGYTPARVTHSSDYFDQLYEWAVALIKKNLAYVCHQSVDEMRGFEVKQSPWRDRPIEESVQLFEAMRLGKFDEGAATLRLKIVLEEGKVDPVAYRIKYVPHHRTGNKWCIYPTYDYTHCLCDSIENITHSMCTKEFQSRRSSYYWLCNALDIYCPVQWEYGRLNVYYAVVSKRKIKALIDHKIVSDWDDPRLFTLAALRRRGIPAEAINNFVAQLGITMAQMTVDPQMLDAAARDYLNTHAPRTMAVLEPLKLIIENFDEMKLPSEVTVPDFPSEPSRSEQHLVAFDRVLYIERSDYRDDSTDKGYRRLTKTQHIGLKYLGIVLSHVRDVKNESGVILEVIVRASPLSAENKPKAFVHWVAKPVCCRVRLYERLFRHKNPEDTSEVPDGFLSDCNRNSLKVLDPVFIDESIAHSKVYDKYQFERVGFFSVDSDSNNQKLIFNRTVLLKEDAGKN
ncbi:putative glutamine--tRNA ligase [Toxocara canis]|uniref:Probable glutamine--tRNA ligase n=1 Tax=Toxocara canis TaxID=6265 RepID=A0A0B2UN27_TOXCA|nr:putative glutamine--tRNA ligase [Toxocara canis]